MSGTRAFGLSLAFAGPNPFVPCVADLLAVTTTSAVSEPRTSDTTTTPFFRFLDGAAFVAHGLDGRRDRGWW